MANENHINLIRFVLFVYKFNTKIDKYINKITSWRIPELLFVDNMEIQTIHK